MTIETRQRLDAAIRAVAPIHGTSGDEGSVRIDFNNATAQQQTDAAAVLAAFDFSQAAQDAWQETQAATAAKATYDANTEAAKIARAIVLTLLDELNILRGIIIGIGSLTWDPASMANGSGATSPNITVAGAAFGDFAVPSAPYSLQGITATAFVSAANTVNIRLENQTGGNVNLASGNWTVCVERKVALPARTAAQARTAIRNKVDAD